MMRGMKYASLIWAAVMRKPTESMLICLAIGLVTFFAACFVGAVINVRIAEFLRDAGSSSYVAAACGLIIGAVWNYGVTSITTWRQVREPRVSVRTRSAAVPSVPKI